MGRERAIQWHTKMQQPWKARRLSLLSTLKPWRNTCRKTKRHQKCMRGHGPSRPCEAKATHRSGCNFMIVLRVLLGIVPFGKGEVNMRRRVPEENELLLLDIPWSWLKVQALRKNYDLEVCDVGQSGYFKFS